MATTAPAPSTGREPYDGRTPLDNYSRAVEFAIDEESMEIEQVWEYGSDIEEILYASFVSDVDWLDNGNILIDFGGTRVMGGVMNTVTRDAAQNASRRASRRTVAAP